MKDKSNTKTYVIELITGDWSGDGHEKTASLRFRCNVSSKELEKAYKAGAKLLKHDITKHCGDYEDNGVPTKLLDDLKTKLLKEFGEEFMKDYYFNTSDEDFVTEGIYNIGYEEYTDIYMFIAKLGNHELVYKQVKEVDSIHIGGYGLFY